MASGVLGAVIAVWAADTALQSLIPNGLWSSEVPPGTPLPHAALFDLGTRREKFSEGDQIETTSLRVEIFADRDPTLPLTDPGRPAEAVEKMAARAADVIDAGTLNVTGYSHMDLRCTTVRIDPEQRRDVEGERVWKATLTVTAIKSRARG